MLYLASTICALAQLGLVGRAEQTRSTELAKENSIMRNRPLAKPPAAYVFGVEIAERCLWRKLSALCANPELSPLKLSAATDSWRGRPTLNTPTSLMRGK